MLESTFLEDWDEIGTKMAKKGHLLPKSGINSELVSIQRVKGYQKRLTLFLGAVESRGGVGRGNPGHF